MATKSKGKALPDVTVKELCDDLDAQDLKQAEKISARRDAFLASVKLSKIDNWRDAKLSIEIERLLRGKGGDADLPKGDGQDIAKIDALIADAEKRAGGNGRTCH